MAKISDIDKNFKIKNTFDKKNLCWINALSEPFLLHGIFHDGKKFKRMDSDTAKKTNNGVYSLHTNTSGGRLTFETDSQYIALSTSGNFVHFPHMPLTGTAGFDIFVLGDDGEFHHFKTFVPPTDCKNKYESIVEFGEKKLRKLLVHFPLYSDVNDVNIGLESDAVINSFNPYCDKLPIVYYGSSITQGGCASRPGNNYPAIVSMKNRTDFICLGFSGNAHGEDIMAEYIASLPMSVFVMDYDHNDMREPEKLKERHNRFYQTVRAKNPDLPIIIISAPYSFSLKPQLEKTVSIVRETYLRAKENGDNVYFIDGREFFGKDFAEFALVDGSHPNDFGFVKMAEAVLKCLK